MKKWDMRYCTYEGYKYGNPGGLDGDFEEFGLPIFANDVVAYYSALMKLKPGESKTLAVVNNEVKKGNVVDQKKTTAQIMPMKTMELGASFYIDVKYAAPGKEEAEDRLQLR